LGLSSRDECVCGDYTQSQAPPAAKQQYVPVPQAPPVQQPQQCAAGLGRSHSLPKELGIACILKGMTVIAPDGQFKTNCPGEANSEVRFYPDTIVENALVLAHSNNARTADVYATLFQDSLWELSGWVTYGSGAASDFVLLSGAGEYSPGWEPEYLMVRLFRFGPDGRAIPKPAVKIWLNSKDEAQTELYPSLMPYPGGQKGDIVGGDSLQ